MIWKARLTGNDFDLADLSVLFSSGGTQVLKDEDGYCLASTEIDNRPTEETFYEAAQRVLALVNGVGKADKSSYQPVALTGAYHEGDKRHAVASPASIHVRTHISAAAVVIGVDGKETPPSPPPGPSRVATAARHPDAAEALQLMGTPEPTNWFDLYKVYEIIREAVKPTRLEDSGLATKEDLSAFTASANRPDVGGSEARHARMGGGPPKRSMDIAEARHFIGRLLTTWLDSLH